MNTRRRAPLSLLQSNNANIIHPVALDQQPNVQDKRHSSKGLRLRNLTKTCEQPESVVNTMRGRVNFKTLTVTLGGIKEYASDIRGWRRRLIMIACGTSYHSAIAELASDFLDRVRAAFICDVCVFISQSGETTDTLNALRYCKLLLIVGVTNTVGGSIFLESYCSIHINAGPEIGVASTKAYTSQMLALLMFALVMSEGRISMQLRRQEIKALSTLPDQIRQVLKLDQDVRTLAKTIMSEKSMLIMGRGYNFATCLEGVLKVKELSYMHYGKTAGALDKTCTLLKNKKASSTTCSTTSSTMWSICVTIYIAHTNNDSLLHGLFIYILCIAFMQKIGILCFPGLFFIVIMSFGCDNMAANVLYIEHFCDSLLCRFEMRPFNADKTRNMRGLNTEGIDRLITSVMIRPSPLVPEVRQSFFRSIICKDTKRVTKNINSLFLCEPCLNRRLADCFTLILHLH